MIKVSDDHDLKLKEARKQKRAEIKNFERKQREKDPQERTKRAKNEIGCVFEARMRLEL